MKLSKIVNAVCILIAFNLFVWLFVSDFLVVREYSYAYSKIKLTGYEVFTACQLITPVIISVIALFILSIVNIFRQKFGASKTIWLYSGYTWEDIWSDSHIIDEETLKVYEENKKRKAIIMLSDVFVDGRYINDQRDITLKWRGSSNQRVLDIQKSIEQNTIVLHCD